MITINMANGRLLIFSALVTVAMLIGNLMEQGRKNSCTILFERLVYLNLIYNVADVFVVYHLNLGGARTDFSTRAADILMVLAYYGIMYLFVRFLVTYLSYYTKVAGRWVIFIDVVTVVSMAMRFVFLAYADGPNNLKIEDWMFLISNITAFLYALGVIAMLLWYRRCMALSELLIMMTFIVLPAFGGLVRLIGPNIVSFPVCITLSLLLINNFIHMKLADRLKEQEKELVEKQVQIMMSQIRPHFLFNVLNTIYILCDTEPRKAQEAVNHFSRFLRVNLERLTDKETMVPFRTEMEHVKHYLELEKMRYGEDLRVEMDIAAEDFWVPSLTVQPIVENAVKHGIHSRPNGGTVRISTRETEEFYEVCVIDDGVGFDPAETKDDGKVHVGLRNVRERLAVVCEGEVLIESRVGEGTTVRMRVPRRGE